MLAPCQSTHPFIAGAGGGGDGDGDGDGGGPLLAPVSTSKWSSIHSRVYPTAPESIPNRYIPSASVSCPVHTAVCPPETITFVAAAVVVAAAQKPTVADVPLKRTAPANAVEL